MGGLVKSSAGRSILLIPVGPAPAWSPDHGHDRSGTHDSGRPPVPRARRRPAPPHRPSLRRALAQPRVPAEPPGDDSTPKILRGFSPFPRFAASTRGPTPTGSCQKAGTTLTVERGAAGLPFGRARKVPPRRASLPADMPRRASLSRVCPALRPNHRRPGRSSSAANDPSRCVPGQGRRRRTPPSSGSPRRYEGLRDTSPRLATCWGRSHASRGRPLWPGPLLACGDAEPVRSGLDRPHEGAPVRQ